MRKAYEKFDEAAVMSLRAKNLELAEVFELPFTSIIGWAARNGATNLLADLIRNGALKQKSDSSFHGPGLGDAAAGGWARCVRMLLDGGADPMGSTDFQGSAIDQSIETWNQQFAIGDPME